MKTTKIYTSLKEFHKYEITLLEMFKGYNFNLYKYSCVWNNQIEEGFKLEFTQKLTKKDIEKIYKELKVMFEIGCFYLKHKSFNGCVKEYLNLGGCLK